MNRRSSRKWILAAHSTNQVADFLANARPPRLASADLPCPEHRNALWCQATTVSGFTITSEERRSVRPNAGKPNPKDGLLRTTVDDYSPSVVERRSGGGGQ